MLSAIHFNQDKQEVVGVDWHDARRFCARADGRLPNEAEWEFARFCGDWRSGSSYPFGEK